MRESRLGFGCQLVFSAIISSAGSTNAPGDPAPSPHLAAAHGRAGHLAAPAPPTKKQTHAPSVCAREGREAETRPFDGVLKVGG